METFMEMIIENVSLTSMFEIYLNSKLERTEKW